MVGWLMFISILYYMYVVDRGNVPCVSRAFHSGAAFALYFDFTSSLHRAPHLLVSAKSLSCSPSRMRQTLHWLRLLVLLQLRCRNAEDEVLFERSLFSFRELFGKVRHSWEAGRSPTVRVLLPSSQFHRTLTLLLTTCHQDTSSSHLSTQSTDWQYQSRNKP